MFITTIFGILKTLLPSHPFILSLIFFHLIFFYSFLLYFLSTFITHLGSPSCPWLETKQIVNSTKVNVSFCCQFCVRRFYFDQFLFSSNNGTLRMFMSLCPRNPYQTCSSSITVISRLKKRDFKRTKTEGGT